MRASRSYRTKLEVLRDFLRAAHEPAPKTRIIGTANLNFSSFQKYLRLCTEQELITSVSGGYVTTPRASPVLEAIESVLLKTSELEAAVQLLERNALGGRPADGGGGSAFRHVLREAWNEIAVKQAESLNGRGAAVLVPAGAGPAESEKPLRRTSPPRAVLVETGPPAPTLPAVRRRASLKGSGNGARRRSTGPTARSDR